MVPAYERRINLVVIRYCDICGHQIGTSISNMFPQVYRVRQLDESKEELMLCNKCRDRLFRVIRMESRKDWKKELKGMRI